MLKEFVVKELGILRQQEAHAAATFKGAILAYEALLKKFAETEVSKVETEITGGAPSPSDAAAAHPTEPLAVASPTPPVA